MGRTLGPASQMWERQTAQRASSKPQIVRAHPLMGYTGYAFIWGRTGTDARHNSVRQALREATGASRGTPRRPRDLDPLGTPTGTPGRGQIPAASGCPAKDSNAGRTATSDCNRGRAAKRLSHGPVHAAACSSSSSRLWPRVAHWLSLMRARGAFTHVGRSVRLQLREPLG
jgi:hypothetical protein